MSIKALPQETCRLLGSTTAIASPLSLVKELLDNAIDANATSIEVFISSNTVDKIEVRDNGHGILPADWDSLGRRGHTSKLTCFEDLQRIGGNTLGFRGQGLASAATLGYVSVTTRTSDGNAPVATTFRLAPHTGGISVGSQKTVSAPAGTTISVTCLFRSLPVRRKVALQDATKTLSAVKALLCSYALARPNLRLTFKVLQQNPSRGWKYCASPGGHGKTISIREAVLLLFGKDVARLCQDVAVSISDLLDGQATLFHSPSDSQSLDIVFDAFLPQPGADLTKLAMHGFVSVDGRPLSSTSGIAKKLLSIFRTRLSRAAVGAQQKHIQDAFIRLDIKCPAGCYDPNVESSKSTVLFTSEALVCDAFERLCGNLYGNGNGENDDDDNDAIESEASSQATTPLHPPHRIRLTLREEDSNRRSPGQQSLPSPYQRAIGNIQPSRPNRGQASSPVAARRHRRVVPSTPPNHRPIRAQSGISQLQSMFSDNGSPPQGRSQPSTGPRRESRLASTSSQYPGSVASTTWVSGQREGSGLQTPPSSSPSDGLRQGRLSVQRTSVSSSMSSNGLTQTPLPFAPNPQTPAQSGKDLHAPAVTPRTTDTSSGRRGSTSTVSELELGLGLELELHNNNSRHLGRPTGEEDRSDSSSPEQGTMQPSLELEAVGKEPQVGGSKRKKPGTGTGTSHGRPTTMRSQQQASRKPVFVLEVDLGRLKRAHSRFVHAAAQQELAVHDHGHSHVPSHGPSHDHSHSHSHDYNHTLSNMSGISGVKKRLRAAVSQWLERNKPKGTTEEGPVKVEFYFRRALKEQARAALRDEKGK